jgi:hypothetical protein
MSAPNPNTTAEGVMSRACSRPPPRPPFPFSCFTSSSYGSP